MNFLGIMECQSNSELLDVLGKLANFPKAKIERQGLKVIVEYFPDDNATDEEASVTISKLTDICESVSVHGISLI